MSQLTYPTEEGQTTQAVSRILRNEKSGCEVNVPYNFQLPERPDGLPTHWLPGLMGLFDDDVLVVMDQTMAYHSHQRIIGQGIGWYQDPIPLSSVVIERKKAKLPNNGLITPESFWEMG